MRASLIVFLTLNMGGLMAYSGRLKDVKALESEKDLVSNIGESEFSRIDSLGFVLVQTGKDEIYDLYQGYYNSPYTPMYVSVDLTFHTMHLLVDRAVRKMEVEELLPKLESLVAGMLEQAKKDYAAMKGEGSKIAEAELIYFAVAQGLLGNDPEVKGAVKTKVDEELARIERHEGIFDVTFLAETKEDYSQYVPRGHYTRSDDLKRYFKAMMWLGRLPLHVPKEGNDPQAFRTALLVSYNLSQSAELKGLWKEIYNPTAFFFGSAEDLTVEILEKETSKFYGNKKIAEILGDAPKLMEFAKLLRKSYQPKILSEYAESKPGEEPIEVPVSFRFMPQRFVPDSYMMTELVADRVRDYLAGDVGGQLPFTCGMTEMGPMRVFPRGLDVMSVIGWQPAEEIISADGDAMYENYPEQLEKMRTWYSSLSEEERVSSIYFKWFEMFSVYKQAVPPPDVDADAWARKMLFTTLGSWTELRHDAILYAKQSYTGYVTGAPPGRDTEPPPPPLELAVIEESPEIYVIMAECSRMIADFIGEKEGYNQIRETFIEFEETLLKMDTLARKQMFENLSKDEHAWLWRLPGKLSGFQYMLGDIPETEADERMALVADVHTDPNTKQVLEEATGNPARMYVIVGIGGKKYVAQGAAFTYYEFKQPLSDRLTDEAWQARLDSYEATSMPSWTDIFFTR